MPEQILLMPLSHSRIEQFNMCPFMFFKKYIEKASYPKGEPLRVGSCVHEIIEECERFCLEETILQQYPISELSGNLTVGAPIVAFVKASMKEFNLGTFLRSIFRYPSLMEKNGINIIDFYRALDKVTGKNEIIAISAASEWYQKLYKSMIEKHGIQPGNEENDVRNMCEYFLSTTEFKRYPGEIIYLETSFAFDPTWVPVEWMDATVAFRGKGDKIIFNYDEKTVVVVDYKTSRKAMTKKEAERDHQLKLYLLFMRKIHKDSFAAITVTWDYVRLKKQVSLSFIGGDIDKVSIEAEDWILDNRQKIHKAIKENNYPCNMNKYCDDCHERLTGCKIFGGKSSTDIEKPDVYMIRTDEDAINTFMFVKAVRYKADALNAKLKTYVEGKGRIPLGNGAFLGVEEEEEREYNTKDIHALLLSKGVDPDLIYKFTTMTRANVDKLLLKAKVMLKLEELDKVSKIKVSREFGLIQE